MYLRGALPCKCEFCRGGHRQGHSIKGMDRQNCQLLSLALCGCDRVCDATGIEILIEFLEIVFLGGCKILLQLFWQGFEISIEFLDSLKIFKVFLDIRNVY